MMSKALISLIYCAVLSFAGASAGELLYEYNPSSFAIMFGAFMGGIYYQHFKHIWDEDNKNGS